MLETAIHSSWPRQGDSLLPSTQKKGKSQTSRRRNQEPLEVTLWYCCFCGHGSMTYNVPACDICNNPRCSHCISERIQVGWKAQKQLFYTWTKNAALRKEAALLGLATAEPEPIQPPDLRHATTAIACTTLEPGPTCDYSSFRDTLPSVITPAHVTLQSLNEHDPCSVDRDPRLTPTVRHRLGFESSSSFLNEVDTVDIAPDPSSLACPITNQGPDWLPSIPLQKDVIDKIILAFHRWRAEGGSSSSGSSPPTNTVPPNSRKPRQSAAPGQSRKRSSNRGSSPNQAGAKRPRVSSYEVLQEKKDDKRLLACPFWKKDPIRHRNCFKGQKRIRDVKQHLRRSHIRPMFCRRCGMGFGDDEAGLTEHSRAAEQCETRNFSEPDGITAAHQRALKGYSDRSADETQQWYVIWDYLFPAGPNGEPPPPPRPSSPYADEDLSDCMSLFLDWTGREGWRTIRNDPDPRLRDAAFHIDEETLQACLDRLYENFLAERSTSSQQSLEESPIKLPGFSSPGERELTSDAAWIDQRQPEDDTTALSDFAMDLEFENNLVGYQIDSFLDNFTTVPSVGNIVAQPFPVLEAYLSLNSDHEIEYPIQAATLDPTLISR